MKADDNPAREEAKKAFALVYEILQVSPEFYGSIELNFKRGKAVTLNTKESKKLP